MVYDYSVIDGPSIRDQILLTAMRFAVHDEKPLSMAIPLGKVRGWNWYTTKPLIFRVYESATAKFASDPYHEFEYNDGLPVYGVRDIDQVYALWKQYRDALSTDGVLVDDFLRFGRGHTPADVEAWFKAAYPTVNLDELRRIYAG
jgi:hypothetical protein